MRHKWDIRDLVDFEYYLYQDEETSNEELSRRDRAFYLGLEEIPADRPSLFHRWLSFRLEKDGPKEGGTPGEAFAECFSILKKGFPLAGLLSGIGVAIGLLQYQGTIAVNVSNYFGVLVVLQLLMLLVLVIALIYRRKTLGSGIQAAYPLLSRILIKWSANMSQSALRNMGGTKTAKVQSGLGELRLKNALYGRVIYQPVFQLAQSFGVLFNLGALGTTLLAVFTKDLAFAWQSSVLSSPTIYGIARFLALPWGWIWGEGVGYPSLAQVEGSQMILKDGLRHLASSDLASWWLFLCLCLTVYGLIPRLALWLYARFTLSRSLDRLNFTHAVCERLYRRMATPMLESAGTPSPGLQVNASDDANPLPALTGAQGESTLLLIPAELAGELDGDTLTRIVEQSVGRTVSRTRPYSLGKHGLGELGIRPLESVTLYQEAWQPPIQEYLSFIKRLRQHVAPETALIILLNGRTKPGETFAAVSDIDRQTWTQVIKRLADPYLGLAEVVLT